MHTDTCMHTCVHMHTHEKSLWVDGEGSTCSVPPVPRLSTLPAPGGLPRGVVELTPQDLFWSWETQPALPVEEWNHFQTLSETNAFMRALGRKMHTVTTGRCSSGRTFPHLVDTGLPAHAGHEGQWERCLWAQLWPCSAVHTQPQASGKLVGYLDPVPCCPHLRVGTVMQPPPRLSWKLSS